jgi:hypothetical protein
MDSAGGREREAKLTKCGKGWSIRSNTGGSRPVSLIRETPYPVACIPYPVSRTSQPFLWLS